MNEENKRKSLRRYFRRPPNPWLPILLFVIGAAGVLIAVAAPRNNGLWGVGGIFAVILGLLWLIALYAFRGSSPSDREVDQWLGEDLGKIAEQALNKLGLDKSQVVREPLTITGPILWATTGVPSKELLYKKGKDDIVRFAVYRVTVIYLTDQLLGAYACDFNSLKNVALNERTDEYHYRDIVLVTTEDISTSYTLPTGVSLVHAQAFRLAVSSGDRIEVTIGAAKLSEITRGTIPDTGAEKAVQVIRAMLREKKK